jgi:hypothetical protein
MCAYVTNHHLWSYLLFMYGAMSTLQWWRASFKESRLLGKHERKRKRKYRKLFSNLDACYPPRSVCPRARIVNDKLFNCRKKYL